MTSLPTIQPSGKVNPRLMESSYLQENLRLAKHLSIDLTRVQYYSAFDLLNVVNEMRWMSEFYASALNERDAGVLELIAQIGEDELRRRERAYYGEASHPIVAGFVYLLSTPFGYYKIGCSSKPKNRLMTFGVQLPFEVEMKWAKYSEDMYKLEKELHKRFSERRARGEWFRLTEADLAYITGLTE